MSKKSRLEEAMDRQIFDKGLPDPDREVRFSDDRKWRFDFAWPEMMVALEVEGGVYNQGRHTRPKGFEEDCVKYSMAAIKGWTVIRATGNMIKSGVAIKLVETAIDIAYEAMQP